MPELVKWKRKALQRPGIALSTGRRNSLSGMVSCALLHCLNVSRPKAARTRMQLAWALLDSEEGKRVTGNVSALEEARKERDRHWAWRPEPR